MVNTFHHNGTPIEYTPQLRLDNDQMEMVLTLLADELKAADDNRKPLIIETMTRVSAQRYNDIYSAEQAEVIIIALFNEQKKYVHKYMREYIAKIINIIKGNAESNPHNSEIHIRAIDKHNTNLRIDNYQEPQTKSELDQARFKSHRSNHEFVARPLSVERFMQDHNGYKMLRVKCGKSHIIIHYDKQNAPKGSLSLFRQAGRGILQAQAPVSAAFIGGDVYLEIKQQHKPFKSIIKLEADTFWNLYRPNPKPAVATQVKQRTVYRPTEKPSLKTLVASYCAMFLNL